MLGRYNKIHMHNLLENIERNFIFPEVNNEWNFKWWSTINL